MRFEQDGITYELNFSRRVHDVKVVKTGVLIKSSKPFTSVKVVVVQPGVSPKSWRTYRQTEAGCFKDDHFTFEEGRRAALRKLCKVAGLPKSFKTAMWKAYMDRPRTKSAPKGTPTPVVVQPSIEAQIIPVVDTNEAVQVVH